VRETGMSTLLLFIIYYCYYIFTIYIYIYIYILFDDTLLQEHCVGAMVCASFGSIFRLLYVRWHTRFIKTRMEACSETIINKQQCVADFAA
jgi:hypothetical protein